MDTPSASPSSAAAIPGGAAEATSTDARYFNRELSWLAFNRRVLEEACNPRHPLLERVRFLSISANNLDEFFMVRVAGLKAHQTLGVEEVSPEGMTVAQQLATIKVEADRLVTSQHEVWGELQAQLDQAGHESHRRRALGRRNGALARPAFPRADLSGSDTPGDRSGASLPLHPQQGPEPHLRTQEGEDQRPRADHGARDAPSVHPHSRRDRPLCRDGNPNPPQDRLPVPPVRGPSRRRIPRHPRQRHRGRGGSRGSRALFPNRHQAAAARPRRSPGAGAGHARKPRRRGPGGPGGSDRDHLGNPRLPWHDRPIAIGRGGPARPQVSAVQSALSRADSRARRRLLRGDQGKGHPGPTPVRKLRGGGRVHPAGRCRSRRRGDQADALSRRQTVGDHPCADRCRRGGQVRNRRDRAKGAVRRRAEFGVGQRARARRSPGRLRVHRVEDPRQGIDGRAPRGEGLPHLLPFRHRQLSPGDARASTPTSATSQRTRRLAAMRQAVQLHHRLSGAEKPRSSWSSRRCRCGPN